MRATQELRAAAPQLQQCTADFRQAMRREMSQLAIPTIAQLDSSVQPAAPTCKILMVALRGGAAESLLVPLDGKTEQYLASLQGMIGFWQQACSEHTCVFEDVFPGGRKAFELVVNNGAHTGQFTVYAYVNAGTPKLLAFAAKYFN